MLRYIIEKVKIRGDILLGKVYGYTDRYSDLKQCLLSNTFSVVPSLLAMANAKRTIWTYNWSSTPWKWPMSIPSSTASASSPATATISRWWRS